MGLYDLADRLNWQQAARILGVAKSTFFKLVKQGKFRAHGMKGCSFYLKSEILAFMEKKEREKCD